MKLFQRLLHRPFFIKLLNWEYWSFNMVYLPIILIWVWLAAKAKSFFFFSAANPSITNGGFLMESKKAIYDILPPDYYPKTVYIKAGTSIDQISKRLELDYFNFPLIAKPDVGGQGKGVKKIYHICELKDYAKASIVDFLIQEFVNYENEAGIFYYRLPTEGRGNISGIVRKEFLTVTGDGKSTIKELCKREKRFILQLPALQKAYGERIHEILPMGAPKILVPYGNHVRGAKFLDDSHLIDEKLTATIDEICKQIKGFYYGRMDIRFNNWNELKEGKNFSIIELNGAGSEPTHMYDPRHSLFFAWKEIIRHWFILCRVSILNHKKGIPYLSVNDGLKMLRENKIFEKKLAEQNV